MSETEIKQGEYAEGMPWKLIIPYESDFADHVALCPHAVLKGEPEPQLRSDGSVWGHKQRFTLPKGVAECQNEGGHNGTTLCLECLDEARRLTSVNSPAPTTAG